MISRIVITLMAFLCLGQTKSQDFFPLAPGNFWIFDILDEEGQTTGQFGYTVNDTFIYNGILFYDVSFLFPDSTGMIADTLLGPLWFDHPSNPVEVHQFINRDSSLIFAYHNFNIGTMVQTLVGGGVVLAAGDVSVPAGDFSDCIQIMDNTGSSVIFAPDVGFIKAISDGVDVNVLVAYHVTKTCALSATANVSHVNCFGGDDGNIAISIMGGTAPFSFEWSGPLAIGDEQEPTGLLAGNYEVTITDNDGCAYEIDDIVLDQPARLQANITGTDESAFGLDDGIAGVNPSGGTPPYQVLWSNGNEGQQSAGLSPGTYSVTIEDANGCTVSDSVTINAFQCTLGVMVDVDDPICAGDSGLVTLTITGEDPPVNIIWSSGFPDQMAQVLPPGIHSVVVTDSHFCTLVLDFEITEPEPLVIQVDSIGHDLGSDDGFIFTTVSGGAPPYAFSWSDESGPVSSGEDLAELPAGTYSLAVTDANNCTSIIDSIVIETIVAVVQKEEGELVFYPNPTHDILYWKSNTPFSPTTFLEVFDMHGRKVLQTPLSEGRIDLNGIVSGWYLLKCNFSGQTLYGQVLKIR